MADLVTFHPETPSQSITRRLQSGEKSRFSAPSLLNSTSNFPAQATKERIKRDGLPDRHKKSYEIAATGRLGKPYEIMQADFRIKRLEKWEMLDNVKKVLPEHRTAGCMDRAPGASGVSVHVHVDSHGQDVGAHYDSIFTCGCVWTCPVCSSKISRLRRGELKTAIDFWSRLGGQVVMLTLTIPHHSGQKLHEVRDLFQDARRRFRNRKAWKTWAQSCGFLGSVRALETTHGSNGWHVHTHELMFLDNYSPEKVREYKSFLLKAWQSACESSGLGTPNDHGVDLQDAEKAAGYVSKFGAEFELTSTHTKRGNLNGKTPWDLLRSGTSADAKLFREFAEVFHGSRQLVWSRGLRSLLNLSKEQSDEELSKQSEATETVDIIEVYVFDHQEWSLIKKTKSRGIVLEIARESGERGILSFLKRLKNEKKKSKKEEIRKLENLSDSNCSRPPGKFNFSRSGRYL